MQRSRMKFAHLLESIVILWGLCQIKSVVLHCIFELVKAEPRQRLQHNPTLQVMPRVTNINLPG